MKMGEEISSDGVRPSGNLNIRSEKIAITA